MMLLLLSEKIKKIFSYQEHIECNEIPVWKKKKNVWHLIVCEICQKFVVYYQKKKSNWIQSNQIKSIDWF